MRVRRRLLRCASLIGVFGAMTAAGLAATAHWSSAIEVPGTADLNRADAAVTSVSCGSPGNCAAGGFYDSPGSEDHGVDFPNVEAYGKAFVVNERNGVWGAAVTVPTHGLTSLNSISCATASFCAAGGSYTGRRGRLQAWVMNERNGVWAAPIKVPGTTGLNRRDAFLFTISCPVAGFCAAGGTYEDSRRGEHAFVVNETNGVWGKAIEVPGPAALHRVGTDTAVYSISCAAANSCAAGGVYGSHAFVVDERNGVWRRATEVPGEILPAHSRGVAAVNSVSCATPRFCAAGGAASTGVFGNTVAFVVNEEDGVWRKAIAEPGSALVQSHFRDANVGSISCASAGTCTAGGGYADGYGGEQAFVVRERHGVWRKAIEVPGLATLDAGNLAELDSISCATGGSCAAGGYYSDGSGGDDNSIPLQTFVVNEKRGVWQDAIEVPGSAILNVGANPSIDPFGDYPANASVTQISCARPGSCAAGGFYTDSSGNTQAFAISK